MGLSTFRRAQELERLVSQGDAHKNGMSDADLASHLLAPKAVLKAKWGKYTCARYLLIAKRFERPALAIMDKWARRYGRSALLDSLDRMRSATTAAQTCEEMTVLASALYWEQVCKIRTSLGHRSKASAGDCTALCRGLLLRHVFYKYARQIVPQLSEMMVVYGTWKWYHLHYSMDEHGRLQQGAASSDE